MNISHRYRYLYFVIPKCASATVRNSLIKCTDIGYPIRPWKQNLTSIFKGDFDFINIEQHIDIQHFLKFKNGTKYFNSYFKFTFIRNPYDRIYSAFLQEKMASITWGNWAQAKRQIFDSIGDDFNRYICEYVSKADLLNAWDWICFRPMTAFTHKDGKLALDFVGRAENLSDDLAFLGKQLGIKITKSKDYNVNSLNHSSLKNISKYNRDAIKVVNTIYQQDFECFNYPLLDENNFPQIV